VHRLGHALLECKFDARDLDLTLSGAGRTLRPPAEVPNAMEARLDARAIVEAVPIPAILLGSDDSLLACNAGGRATFLDPAATEGKNFREVAVEAWLDALLSASTAAKISGRTQYVETSGGASVRPVADGHGRFAGVLVLADLARRGPPAVRDVRALDQELAVANEELSVANEELSARLQEIEVNREEKEQRNRFLAMLAHELRNPLAAIASALVVIRRRRITAADRLAEQALRIAERQVKTQARLLDDLLDVSRIVLGKVTLRPEPADLVTVVREAVAASSSAAQARAQRLDVVLPEIEVIVLGDLVRLEQIVTNLIGNAIKYTPAGGRIEARLTTGPGEATLVVSDTGAGIDPELLPHVFDLFTQGDATRARSAGGLGIGLTVARHLVELHGGAIEARSGGKGRGASFEVRLPRQPAGGASATETAGDARTPTPLRSRRILVVDDNRDAREMLRAILELDGHHVQDAAGGAQGVKLAVEWSPDLALIDIGLPEVDGYEVARRIRRRLGAAVRLIALTGYGDADARRLSGEAGFDAHVVKPVDPDVLSELIG
jgi:signal transduction histidine kinase